MVITCWDSDEYIHFFNHSMLSYWEALAKFRIAQSILMVVQRPDSINVKLEKSSYHLALSQLKGSEVIMVMPLHFILTLVKIPAGCLDSNFMLAVLTKEQSTGLWLFFYWQLLQC